MVAESGSLSRASDRLRLAQPALSRQIRMLEADVGFDLFVRSGRGMQLTDQGEALLSRVSGLMQQLDSAVADARSLSTEPSGRVVLGCIPSVSYVAAGRIAVRVAREFPKVSLRILEGYAGHLIDWLHRGEADIALLYGPAADLHLRVTDIMFEELFLVGPSSGTVLDDPVPTAALGQLNLVLPSRPHGLRMVVEAAAAKAGVSLQVRYEADSFLVLKELVAAGLGCTVLPLSAFFKEQDQRLYKINRIVKPTISRQIVVALPASRTDTRATAAIRSLVLDEIGQMAESGEWQTMPS